MPSHAVAQDLTSSMQTQRWNPKKINRVYEALADLMLASPNLTQHEMGSRLGYSQVWVGLVINSDSFKAYFAGRRAAIENALTATITSRLEKLAHDSLDLLEKGIADQGPKISLSDRVNIADKVLDRLGYGSKAGGGLNMQVNVNTNVNAPVHHPTVDAQTLSEARSALRAVEQMRAARNSALPATNGSAALPAPQPIVEAVPDIIDLVVE